MAGQSHCFMRGRPSSARSSRCVIYLLLVVLVCLCSPVWAEQITNLPQDQDKWYVSVVGDANDATYQSILEWFDSTPDLKELKSQVHFCPVTSDNPIFGLQTEH